MCVADRSKDIFVVAVVLVVWLLLLLIIPYTVGQKKVTDDVYIPRRRRSLPKWCTAPEPLETRKITTKRSSFTYRSGITTTYTWNNHFFARMTMAYAVALITGGHQRESIFEHWRYWNSRINRWQSKKLGFCWSEIRENIAFRIYYLSYPNWYTNCLCQFWLDGLNRWKGINNSDLKIIRIYFFCCGI